MFQLHSVESIPNDYVEALHPQFFLQIVVYISYPEVLNLSKQKVGIFSILIMYIFQCDFELPTCFVLVIWEKSIFNVFF